MSAFATRVASPGCPEINASVKDGIHKADQLVGQAIAAADDPNAPRVAAAAGGAGAGAGSSAATGGSGGKGGGIGTKLRTALLTGVSYMIPFVAAGGLLIALGLPAGWLRDRYDVSRDR